ncbi:MAG: DUF3618 domain-containing protein [Hyphomicrobiales bacterium]|nr:MAG: DUF3618 domain-containing protein [Hyphomicrobiales bacterium]
MTYDNKSAADLEREVEAQRSRVEERIGEIKDKLSPGQLLDEALSYTKHGGAHFASNLGQQISSNPLPAALVGVGLAWLISSNMNGNAPHTAAPSSAAFADDDYYPYARLPAGGLRRTSHARNDAGEWWSEFESSAGHRYKARSNELGERASHFTDEAGKMFSGFIDESGSRIRDFQDEAGNKLAEARGWADHNWRMLQRNVSDSVSGAAHAVRDAASSVMSGGRQFGGTAQQQTEQLSRQIVGLFDQQPLIAGALAFAMGAAVGAALPATAQEDELLGKPADKLRGKAMKEAGKLYEQGKEKAAELYDEASSEATRLYGDARDTVTDIANGQGGPSSMSRH